VETVDGKIGFVVDKVIGQHQTVIKNLGKIYRNVTGISGATILGDGTIALIVDVPKIVKSSVLEEISQAV
jgi:two-component system chemotaxis sensor kinase CheA